jgi:hypothetical protein
MQTIDLARLAPAELFRLAVDGPFCRRKAPPPSASLATVEQAISDRLRALWHDARKPDEIRMLDIANGDRALRVLWARRVFLMGSCGRVAGRGDRHQRALTAPQTQSWRLVINSRGRHTVRRLPTREIISEADFDPAVFA